ncbi:DUF1614 domain-containing protein [Desulfosoma caldarium]|uniref:Putative membrane protein n=1 Tax=Desulfosoma caldarium TaxID=610254 RepID=A0A3N1VIQ6_9BACT|nr:DUF1614 domain-containing protein [Desulfosoma caldarium]ROR01790.1 putative membrane protein [Desulfosoma caldarium]
MFFPPFLVVFFFLFVFLLFLVFGLVKFGLFAMAFARLGIPPEHLFSLLFLCMIGSMINIPVKRLSLDDEPAPIDLVSFFGLRYRPPRWRRPREMVLAVNVGGAVIPTMISLYLLIHAQHPFRMLLATGVVTYVIHRMARPVPGLGIATPMFIPPLVAALAALVLNASWAPPTAYVAGTLGTLIGADLLNLHRLRELRAPVASIGGAGTFDGIFLTGILAVLLSW